MPPFRIVEALDVIEHSCSGLVARAIRFARCALGLQGGEEALRRRIVPAIAGPAHRTGDTLIRHQPLELLAGVTRLNRLARSTHNLLNAFAAINDQKAGFRSPGDTWANTVITHGHLMLTVLGGLADEPELIRARTGEGRARVVARGVKMGRKPTLSAPAVRNEPAA